MLRTAGSHGPFDLIAIKPGESVVLIQCKKTESERQAFMLIKGFKYNPPLAPDSEKRYIQVMEVWAADAKRILSGGVE